MNHPDSAPISRQGRRNYRLHTGFRARLRTVASLATAVVLTASGLAAVTVAAAPAGKEDAR